MRNVEEWKTWEGRVIDGRFSLRQWLGGSDHSAVFLTERPGHASERAAIKLIVANAADSDILLARWRAAAQLSHPHLIRIFDGGHTNLDETPVLYVVTELAEEDLSQILPQRPLTPAEIGNLLPPLLDTLSYLHAKGLVHGRIKPSNVQAVDDQLKLSADEIRSSSEVSLGEASFTASNPGRRDVFDAPETAAGIVTPAGDLWSVGATIVAAMMQKMPIAGDESQLDPGLLETIPQPFRGIVRECLHLDPQRRCSIDAIRARLEPPGRSVPAEPELVSTRSSMSSARRSRYGWRILLSAIVLFVFAIGLRFFYKGAAQQPSANEAPAIKAEAPPTPSPPPFTPAPAKPVAGTGGDVIRRVVPEIPKSARNTITGTIKVSVRVEVDPYGKVTAAHLTSPGPSRYFANLALKAAREWEFSPPNVGGQAGASIWMLHFRFSRTSTDVSPEQVRR